MGLDGITWAFMGVNGRVSMPVDGCLWAMAGPDGRGDAKTLGAGAPCGARAAGREVRPSPRFEGRCCRADTWPQYLLAPYLAPVLGPRTWPQDLAPVLGPRTWPPSPWPLR